MPIFQSSAFEYTNAVSYHDLKYIRLNNTPNHIALHQKLAGLESHPRHRRARELFDGFSGMLSFELKGGVEAAERFMQNTTIPFVAPSLGGVESLITRPATTSHSGMSSEDRQKLGISESLIRVSVGIEATEDIIEDFDQALKS